MKIILIVLMFVFLLSFSLAQSSYDINGLFVNENKQCIGVFSITVFEPHKLPGWNFYSAQKKDNYYLINSPRGDCKFTDIWEITDCCKRLGLYEIDLSDTS